MTSQTLRLNFSSLKNLSPEQLIETIPPQKAVELTLRSFEACEVSEQEIVSTWCKKLFQSYGPSGIADDDLNRLFHFFSNSIKELLDECGKCENDEQIEKLNQFLIYSLELFTWIHSKTSEFETSKISSFLCFGLISIHNYLVVLSKQASQVDARKLIEKSLQVHSIILGVLTSHPKTFLFDINSSDLGNLISNLCLVGEIVPKLDIKSAVETWKCVTRLASQNIHHGQKGGDVAWLSKPISFLIKEIGRNVQNVYTQDSLSEPIQQIEKYLKVTNFYLRLVQKLSLDFRNVRFSICEEFIATLAIVLNPPIYIAGTPVYKVIMNSIGNDLKEIIPLACKNQEFFQHLTNEHIVNIHSRESILEIVLQVLEMISLKDEPNYMNEGLLEVFFKFVSDGTLITPNSTYNRFVEIFSALQIRFNEERIMRKLVTTILQDNAIQALAAIDIWCTIFMLLDESPRQSHIQFWIQINQSFTTFSTNPAALHTELLLRNLFTLLSEEEKNKIINNVNACIRNKRLFLTLGLDVIPCGPIKQSIIKHFQDELYRLLTKSDIELTVDSYYTIVKNLKLLKTIDFRNDELMDMLFYHLETALEDKNLYLMVESILDFFNIDYVDGIKIQKVLTMIKMNNCLFEELSTKLCFLRFIKRVSKLSRFENLSKEILKTLESDQEIKSFKCLETRHSTFAGNKEDRCDTLWKELVKNRKEVEFKRSHTCGMERAAPLLGTNNSQEDVEVNELLVSLENNINKLEKCANNFKLSRSNFEIIKESVRKLKRIIPE